MSRTQARLVLETGYCVTMIQTYFVQGTMPDLTQRPRVFPEPCTAHFRDPTWESASRNPLWDHIAPPGSPHVQSRSRIKNDDALSNSFVETARESYRGGRTETHCQNSSRMLEADCQSSPLQHTESTYIFGAAGGSFTLCSWILYSSARIKMSVAMK